MGKNSSVLGLVISLLISPISIIAFIFIVLPLSIIIGSFKLAIFICVVLLVISIILYVYGKEIKVFATSLYQKGIFKKIALIIVPLITIILIISNIGLNKPDYYGLHGQLHIVKETNYYKPFILFKDPYSEHEMKISHCFVYIYDSDWNLLRRVQYDSNNKKVALVEFSFDGDKPQLTTTEYVDNVPLRFSPLSYRKNPIENSIFVYDRSHFASEGTITNPSYETYNNVPFRVKTIRNNFDGRPDVITISDAKSIHPGIARVDEKINYDYVGESFSISYYDNSLMRDRFELIERTTIEISHVTVE